MYLTINGIYENGQVILQETAPTQNKMRVLVVFIENEAQPSEKLETNAFSKHWKGQFEPNQNIDDARLDYLAQRYQL